MNRFKQTEGSEIFLEEFGMPFASTPVSAETLAKYRGKLPDRVGNRRVVYTFLRRTSFVFA
ncbi:hypothetical protein [Dialister invisus]|uniref:hypothetical protein n=1 Tax=Dialister invisus TaxID=218538 RepID=UPI00287FFCA2|nr:hypothetical protein [Dialister invisus]